MTREKLDGLIVELKYDEFFAQLRELDSADSDWRNMMIAAQSQYQILKRDRQEGILSPAESVQRENILRKSLVDLVQEALQLSLITDRETKDIVPPPVLLDHDSPKRVIWIWASVVVLALCSLVYFLSTQDKQPESITNKTPVSKDSVIQTPVSSPSTTAKTIPPNNTGTNSTIQKPVSVSSAVLPNVLQVTTTSSQYTRLFTATASEMLHDLHIAHQQGGANYENRIECAFEVKKDKSQSGVREAFKYKINLQIKVFGRNKETCFSGLYTSSTTRIGYPEDSDGDIQSKIIEPGLAEIKTALQQRPPILCNK